MMWLLAYHWHRRCSRSVRYSTRRVCCLGAGPIAHEPLALHYTGAPWWSVLLCGTISDAGDYHGDYRSASGSD